MGRRKVTPPKSECKHPKWIFKKEEDGVRRTCTQCGKSIKEVGRQVHSQVTLQNSGTSGWKSIETKY